MPVLTDQVIAGIFAFLASLLTGGLGAYLVYRRQSKKDKDEAETAEKNSAKVIQEAAVALISPYVELVENQNARIAELDKKVAKLEECQQERDSLEQENHDLKEEMSRLHSEINVLRERVRELEEKVDTGQLGKNNT